MVAKVQEYYENSENRIAGHLLSIGEAFEVNWHFYMPIPKSFSQFKKNACKWGFIEHISKPDRSNMEKFYEDCANGILWHDDSQITRGEIIKKYCNDDNPRTEIYMKSIPQVKEDLKEIVSLFSPDEVNSIVSDAVDLHNVEVSADLTKVAYFLSKIADNHSKKLSKINKSYPGYWKKFESNSVFLQH